MKLPTLNWITLCLCISLVPFSSGAKPHYPKEVIRVGIFPFEPLNFMDDDGSAQGINPDLLREMVRDEHWSIKFVPLTWAEGLEKLQCGEIDLIPSIAYTPERAETLNYCQQSIVEVWGQAFVRKNAQINGIADLAGKTVAIMKKDITGTNFIETANNFGIQLEIREYPTHYDVLEAVQANEADAGIAPNLFGIRNANKYNLIASSIQFSPFSIYFAAKKGRQHDLLSHMDAHLTYWKENKDSFYFRTIDRWLNKRNYPLKHLSGWLIVITVVTTLLAFLLSILLRLEIKRRTKEIVSREIRFREMFQCSPIATALVTYDENIVFLNNRFVELFGYTLQDIPTMDEWYHLAFPEETYRNETIHRWEHSLEIAQQDATYFMQEEYQIVCKDGRTVTVKPSGTFIEQGILVSLVDTTEINQLLNEVRHNEQKYRLLFENMTIGFALQEMIFDHNGIPVDYRFLEVNPAFTVMTGLGADCTGKTATELLPGIEPEWIQQYGKVVNTGIPITFQNYSKELNKYFDVKAFRPAPHQFAVLISDISDRIKMEKEIAQLARFPEDNPNPVLRISGDNSLLYRNKPGKILLKNITADTSIIPDNWNYLIKQAFRSKQAQNSEIEAKDKTYLMTFSPDLQSRCINIYGMDITRERMIEEQYRQTQKMQAIGQLAGGIAHDFNNILQTILGFSEILLSKLEADRNSHDDVLEIQKAARRAAELTNQLLSFSRKQHSEVQLININDVVSDQIKMLKRVIREDIELQLELSPNIKPIKADAGKIQQIIMNLCVNAQDAMPDGGTLSVKTENIEIDEQLSKKMPHSRIGTYCCLSVTDSGFGMSNDILERAFEPFFTTKEIGKGTGLGLSVVYGIIKNYQGWVTVHSSKKEGSEFKIYLPAVPESIEAPTHVPVPAVERTTPAGENECILLIEDDAIILELNAHVLRDAGYQVISAESAQQAIEAFNAEPYLFDLVFSDVILPDHSGLFIASTIRELRPEIPVLLCSGHGGDKIHHDEIQQKGYFFLEKPFAVLYLLRTIREILDGKLPLAK